MNAPLTRHGLTAAALDGALLGLFMISAAAFGTLLEARGATLRTLVPDPFWRRAVMGLAMGVTAAVLIRSPMGQRSGAHLAAAA